MFSMFSSKDEIIHDYCDYRWEFHINEDGAYLPSKHDKVVLLEAANEFNISSEEAEQAFQRVAKFKAEAEAEGMSKSEITEMLKNIVEGNAETPWGKEKLKKQLQEK